MILYTGRIVLNYFLLPLLFNFFFSLNTSFCGELVTNGFLTTGAAVTDSHNDYNNGLKHKVNYLHDFKGGINFRKEFSQSWSSVMQLLGRPVRHSTLKASYNNGAPVQVNGATEEYDFSVTIDWAYVTYTPEWISGFNFHLGKKKSQVWLISDYYDVGILYPWVRPPIEVYGLSIFQSVTGPSFDYTVDVYDWSFEIGSYYGNAKYYVDSPVLTNTYVGPDNQLGLSPSITVGELNGTMDIWGVNLSTSNQNITLRGSFNRSLKTKGSYMMLNDVDGNSTGATVTETYNYDFSTIGLKYDGDTFFSIAEFAYLAMIRAEQAVQDGGIQLLECIWRNGLYILRIQELKHIIIRCIQVLLDC